MNKEKINFRQSRDFGETFNISVKFLRQNFRLLIQCLLFIAGPFILLNAISAGMYQTQSMNFISAIRMAQYTSNPFELYGWSFLLLIVTAILANLALVGTTISFMINYMEKGPDGFTVSDVGRTLLKNIGNILAVFFTFVLFMILFAMVLGVLMIGAGYIHRVVAILAGIGLFFGLLIILPPILWQLSATYIVKMQEKKGVLSSFAKTRHVMRGNFWWTWVIVFCSGLCVLIIAFIFAVPQFIYQIVLTVIAIRGGGSGETSYVFLVVTTICTFCSTLTYCILYVINSFHYYSLAEQKDGTGLMERINEIGNTVSEKREEMY